MVDKTVTLQVRGMSCGHCVKAVEQAVLGIHGVSGIKVALETGTAVVEGTGFDMQALLNAIEEAGYFASIVP